MLNRKSTQLGTKEIKIKINKNSKQIVTMQHKTQNIGKQFTRDAVTSWK